ncbi:rust resistance kinase Lr10-like isoform X2 [Primulina eburnea]|uniref:rust resistance kinase Lr10-like isoform X2 n=1 Tax=Primulina eburnea TaxID=1245227 RepID=UPI003C6C1E8A
MAPIFGVFAFLLILFAGLGVCADDCTPASCSPNGPEVRFPFRLKSRQPQYCGYNPSFDLYCNERNETMLQLPSSEKFVVVDIDYADQTVELNSTTRGCYPQNYQFFLNLSASPFQLSPYTRWSYGSLPDYVIFNCSATDDSLSVSFHNCLNKSTYRIHAIPSSYRFDSFLFVSCTKLYKVYDVPYLDWGIRRLSLSWSEPACGSCESQGKTCSLNDNNTRGHQLLCNNEPMQKQGNVPKRLLISGEILGSFLFVLTLAYLYRLYGSIRKNKEHQMKIESFLEDYKALKPTRFSYADVKKITNEFSEKLGEGSYGIVYKGKLSSEIYVAVKVLNNSHGNGEEFINEVGTIGRIHHVNVVRLVGYCADGFRRALVYEFLPNDSLEKFIFLEGPKRSPLSREKIQDIALGVAKGIGYLHQGCDQQILHFDIKPNNILLDHNFNPKICDFGLAKLCSKEQSAVSMTVARGTMGYIAPEVLSRTFGRVSYKSDVYSFGMLLLEMVGGRKNVDHTVNTSQVCFPKWIYDKLNREETSVHIEEEDDESKIARKLTIVGLLCIQWYPNDRPCMKTVVQMLEGDGNNLTVPPNPFPATITPNSIARMMPGRHHQTELEIISE